MSEHRTTDPHTTSEREPVEHDPVERLVTLAGRRAVLGAERSARLQEAVRPHWRSAVERHASRRFRRFLPRDVWLPAVAAAAVAVAALALLVTFAPSRLDLGDLGRPEAVATLASANGPIRAGDSILAAGDTIYSRQTITSDTTIGELRLRSGIEVRLDRDTRFRLDSGTRLRLEAGAIYIDTLDSSGASLGIETGLGLVEDIGTQFEVRLLPGGMRVRVRDGRVMLHRHELEPVAGSRGEELMIHANGTTKRTRVATWGEPWNWTLELVAARSFDGESLESFLAWVHRESGLEIRFADPDREASLLSQRLLGDLTGLPVDEALATALPTYGIEYAVENGALVLY